MRMGACALLAGNPDAVATSCLALLCWLRWRLHAGPPEATDDPVTALGGELGGPRRKRVAALFFALWSVFHCAPRPSSTGFAHLVNVCAKLPFFGPVEHLILRRETACGAYVCV
jgi:hypothetical protein